MRHSKKRVRWAAARIDGTTTLVEVDEVGATTLVEVAAGGVVRIRMGEMLADGRFVCRIDTTVEALCSAEAFEMAEELPALDAAPSVVADASIAAALRMSEAA